MSTSTGTPAPSQGSFLRGTVGLGRVGGVPVRAHWSVLIITGLIWAMLAGGQLPATYPGRAAWEYVLVGGLAAVTFLVGLLAHEAAHAVVARRNRVQVGTVTLWMLGGLTELGSEAPSPGAELRIAGAGPLVSLLLGLGFGGLAWLSDAAGWPALGSAALAWLAVINLMLAVFNVLPGAPLDGGRLLRAALWWWRGDRRWATVAAARCGRALGVLLVVGGGLEFLFYGGDVSGLWLAIVGWFLTGAARAEEQQVRLDEALSGVLVRDVMTPSPDTADPTSSVAEFIDGHLFAARHSTLPLVEGARPVGLLTLARLRQVPVEARTTTLLGAVACPIAQVPVATPDEALTALLPRLNRAADSRALVVDDGRLVGIVSPVDVLRAVEHGGLRHPAPAGRDHAPTAP